MTQVLTTITSNYVLLVADRRLTFLTDPQKGQVKDDDTCKLVSLCNVCGIGYTGLAQIEGVPTHEWIATTLAREECSDPAKASRVLSERAGAAFSRLPSALRRHTFVIAGWAYFENLDGLRPHVCAITNMLDESGRMLPNVGQTFKVLTTALKDSEDIAIHVIGQPLQLERGERLERNLRKLVSRDISAKAALRLLVEEVIATSRQSRTVGEKVLGVCIPKRAVQSSIESGRSVLLAAQPSEDAASFCYYDPTYTELQQFGPTIVCGSFAATDIRTANDLTAESQSSEMRILTPPKKGQIDSRDPKFIRPAPGRPVVGFEFGISVDNLVVPNSSCAIMAGIKNTGDLPIVFAQGLVDEVGQEVPPSQQGGSIPCLTFAWPTGDWSIKEFRPASRTLFAGIVIPPGEVFEFNFGSFSVPKAPMGSKSYSRLVDLSIRFTDNILGTMLNLKGDNFNLPTNVNPRLTFRISTKSVRPRLSFYPARVIDTATGELISGPVDGSPPPVFASPITDTCISGGKPGLAQMKA